MIRVGRVEERERGVRTPALAQFYLELKRVRRAIHMHNCAIYGGYKLNARRVCSGEAMRDRKSTTNDVHFTSGGGRIRPVENLSTLTPLVSSFPSAPAPLRGGGVDVEVWLVVVRVPFIVVVGRP
jgi:hypothetical protein